MAQREGSNYVGTEFYTNQSQTFYFTAARVSNTRDVKVTWWMTTDCNDGAKSPTYYLCYGQQKLTVNGSVVINWTGTNPTYMSGSRKVWRGFTDTGSGLDKSYNPDTPFYDTNGDYTGIVRWVQILGTKWTSGSFTKTADANGTIQFSVVGNFGWYGKTGLNFSKTFTVKGLIPVETYTIAYAANTQSFLKGNTVSGMPSNQTKTYKVATTVSTKKPTVTNSNYVFNKWITNPKDSFSYGPNSVGWVSGEAYTRDGSTTLNAIWTLGTKTIKFDLNGGTSSSITTQTAKYSTTLTLPKTTEVSKYGYTLSKWQDDNGNYSPGTSYTVTGTKTLKAIYSANSYTITLHDIDNNVLRVLTGKKFDSVLTGDFTYEVPGYECIGWSTSMLPKLDNNSPTPLIVPNNTTFFDNKLYIGCGNYTTANPFYISDGVVRTHIIGKDVDLYPILKYSTSMYVYINNTWKLAMPYVYNNGQWKQTFGYIYDGSNWKH